VEKKKEKKKEAKKKRLIMGEKKKKGGGGGGGNSWNERWSDTCRCVQNVKSNCLHRLRAPYGMEQRNGTGTENGMERRKGTGTENGMEQRKGTGTENGEIVVIMGGRFEFREKTEE